jgi:hypothetical protein
VARPTFLMAEPEPEQAISARKLVLETAKFNVITAHSAREATELCRRFPSIDALIVHANNISSHSPEDLLRLLRQLFGDPRKIDGK